MSCYGRRESSSSSYQSRSLTHRCLTVMAAWTQVDKQNGSESPESAIFPDRMCDPEGKHTHALTHTFSQANTCTLSLSYAHIDTHRPSKVMVCVLQQRGSVLSCLAAITILLLYMERAGEYFSAPLVCCRHPLAPHTAGDDRGRH